MSPVEVFANEIKIFNRQRLSATALSYSSECMIAWFTGIERRIPKGARLCHRSKELAVFRKHKYTAKHYEWNVMWKMLKRYAQNIENLCQNIMLKLLTSCWNITLKIQTVCSKYRNEKCSYILCSKAEIFIHVAIQNLTMWLSYTAQDNSWTKAWPLK